MNCSICQTGETRPGVLKVSHNEGALEKTYEFPVEICACCGEYHLDDESAGQIQQLQLEHGPHINLTVVLRRRAPTRLRLTRWQVRLLILFFLFLYSIDYLYHPKLRQGPTAPPKEEILLTTTIDWRECMTRGSNNPEVRGILLDSVYASGTSCAGSRQSIDGIIYEGMILQNQTCFPGKTPAFEFLMHTDAAQKEVSVVIRSRLLSEIRIENMNTSGGKSLEIPAGEYRLKLSEMPNLTVRSTYTSIKRP